MISVLFFLFLAPFFNAADAKQKKWFDRGCYQRKDEYELDFWFKRQKTMSHDICQTRCAEKRTNRTDPSSAPLYGKYPVAAIYGPDSWGYYLCYCGKRLPSTKVDESKCDSKCNFPGKCGGDDKHNEYYSVHQLLPKDSVFTLPPGKWRERGCYVKEDEYQLDFWFKRRSMTAEDCRNRCGSMVNHVTKVLRNGASPVAAVYRHLCYCGHKMGHNHPLKKADDEEQCSHECVDGSPCGGANADDDFYNVWSYHPNNRRNRGAKNVRNAINNAVVADGASEGSVVTNSDGQSIVVQQQSSSTSSLAIAGLALGACALVIALVALLFLLK